MLSERIYLFFLRGLWWRHLKVASSWRFLLAEKETRNPLLLLLCRVVDIIICNFNIIERASAVCFAGKVKVYFSCRVLLFFLFFYSNFSTKEILEKREKRIIIKSLSLSSVHAEICVRRVLPKLSTPDCRVWRYKHVKKQQNTTRSSEGFFDSFLHTANYYIFLSTKKVNRFIG